MWLIVGLGNPGPQYSLTRHNVGFMAVDYLSQGLQAPNWQTEHKALTSRARLGEHTLLLTKPQTFMNLSGESVQSLLGFYKIPRENLLVLQDEVDIPFGKLRFHFNRGHGGHNGIRNITALLGSPEYTRLKIGVGRPAHPEIAVSDFVLQKFSNEEQSQLPDFLNRAGDAVESLVMNGLSKASSQFNQ